MRDEIEYPPSSPNKQTKTVAEGVANKFFSQSNGILNIGEISAPDLIEQFGSPLFVYDSATLLKRIHQVRSILPARFELFYSIKANPNASILKVFRSEGVGLEVASGGELAQALAVNCQPEKIIFAGPGKTERELAAALKNKIREIHVESLEEIRALSELAQQQGTTARISLRINPLEAAGGAMRMGGAAAAFGIDEEHVDKVIDEAKTLANLSITGIHLFMGTQITNADVLRKQYFKAVEIARNVACRIGPLESIDFGGGWGTRYFEHESELDLNEVALILKQVDEQLASDPLLSHSKAMIEPGRFLVNEAGVYLTKILRTKDSRGKIFAVLDGGMHHHLAASGNLGQTIKRNYPIAVVNKLNATKFCKYELVGPLCTPLDTLGRQITLPMVEPGDLVGVFLSGAYARTSSPLGFLSHEAPAEILVEGGTARLIRRRGKHEDHFIDQTDLGG